jgi:transposase
MDFNMVIPGLKDVVIEQIEEVGERTALHVSLQKKRINALTAVK